MLLRQEPSGPAIAGLDLVEKEECATLVADSSCAFDELGRGYDDSAFGLHRLEDYRCGLVRDGAIESGDVVEVDEADALDQRRHALVVLRLPGERQGAHGSAVKAVACGYEPGPARLPAVVMVAARQLDHALHRLGARVAEEHLVGEGVLHQSSRQPLAIGNLVEVGNVPQLGRLLDQG